LVYPAGYSQLKPDVVDNLVEKRWVRLLDSQVHPHVHKWLWVKRGEAGFREFLKVIKGFPGKLILKMTGWKAEKP
jgi:hypothetical protein